MFTTTEVEVCSDSLCFSLQCSVLVYSGHRITNRSSSNKEGCTAHVLNKTITNSNSSSLQGVWSRHHTHRQQAPVVFPQALPCDHNFILWTGPRWPSLESEEWWNRNAHQFKVSVIWPRAGLPMICVLGYKEDITYSKNTKYSTQLYFCKQRKRFHFYDGWGQSVMCICLLKV